MIRPTRDRSDTPVPFRWRLPGNGGRHSCGTAQRKRSSLGGRWLAIDHVRRQPRAAAGERPASMPCPELMNSPSRGDQPMIGRLSGVHGTKPAPGHDVAGGVYPK
jgi:hypothetical protein